MTPRTKPSEQDRDALRRLFAEHHRTRDPALRQQLALSYGNLAAYLARKFADRGEPLEDIMQVAQIGLLGAIDRYDPSRGIEFTTFATATIVGEIKRYFRDKSWSIHVPRRLRELNNSLMRTVEGLAQRLGRSPTIQEISEAARVPFEDVVEALEVGQAYNPASLDAEPTGGEEEVAALKDHVGLEDPGLAHVVDRHTLTQALGTLPEREQMVLRLRFFEERSQAEVAKQLGVSQMHVSRIQRSALLRLRAALGT
jgi:RNA polymerase sigma-B factor